MSRREERGFVMGVQRERYEGGSSRSSIPRYVLGVLGGTDFPEHGGEEFDVGGRVINS